MHTMDYYAEVERNELDTGRATQVDLKKTALREKIENRVTPTAHLRHLKVN